MFVNLKIVWRLNGCVLYKALCGIEFRSSVAEWFGRHTKLALDCKTAVIFPLNSLLVKARSTLAPDLSFEDRAS